MNALKEILSLFFKNETGGSRVATSEQTTWDTSEFNQQALLMIFVTAVVVTFFLFLFTEPITRTENVMRNGTITQVETTVFSWVKFWWYAVAFYTVASYRFWDPVPIGKQAALTLFGKPLANVGAGAPFAPLGVIQVLTITAQVKQREFPTEPELVDRSKSGHSHDRPLEKKPPLRIQFRDSISDDEAKELFGVDGKFTSEDGENYDEYYAQPMRGPKIPFIANVPIDGLSKRVTAEVHHVVRIRVDDPSLFFSNIGDIEEAFKQIEDEMVSVLTRFYTRMSVAQALMNMQWMSIHLFRAVERRVSAHEKVKSWGINVQTAFVKLIHTSHGINIAISEAAEAPFEKERVVTAAEGERIKRELEGKGAAIAARDLEQKTLEGRAKGLKKLAFEIEVSGSQVQAAEVARAIGNNGNTVVVGAEGFGQLAGIAAATLGQNETNKKKKTDQTSTNETSKKGDDS